MTVPDPTAPSVEDVIAEALHAHCAEWRGEPSFHRVLWCCTCGEWHGDDYDEYQRHQAAAVVAAIRAMSAEQQAELIGAWIEAGLRWNDDIGESRNVARVVGPWRGEA